MTGQRWDVIVVGGGIAGVSIGYELAARHRVVLLEAEATLAFHTTGRSAATWIETYGNAPVRALTAASRAFLTDPPDPFEGPLVSPRPLLYVARPSRMNDLLALRDDVAALTPGTTVLDPSAATGLLPLLRPDAIEGALLDPGALDVDVHALHQGYLRGLRARGGTIATTARLVSARREGGDWVVTDRAGQSHRGAAVVDAAGAWSDPVAELFGARPLGLTPLRRTVFTIGDDSAGTHPVGDGPGPHGPMLIDVEDTCYLKPEPGQYLCSPADQTPQPAGDAKPDELEIARAIDAIMELTHLDARHVRHSWAGLRTFAPDRTPVVGFDPTVEGLFWFAGQGGYGIQLAAALARVGAARFDAAPMPAELTSRGLRAEQLDPARFATR